MRRILIASLVAFVAAAPLAACKPKAAEGPAAGPATNAWLADNGRKPGVVTLPSGVQYKITRSGPETGAHPGPRDEVKVHYEGKLTDGTVFDSSYERGVPQDFFLNQVIPGWSEALQHMRPGDDWMVYIPPELGYGPRSPDPVMPPNSTLIFRVELLDLLPSF